MTQRTYQFDPPLQESATADVAVHVSGAHHTPAGSLSAVVQVWNGHLVHNDRLLLEAEPARARYAAAVEQSAPDLDADTITAIRAALLRLSVLLPQHMATLAPAPAVEAAPAGLSTEDRAALWEQARPLAEDPHILDRAADIVEALGLVGEQKNGQLVYLSATARLLEGPINLVVKGPSSAGKSHLLKMVLQLIPPAGCIDYTSVSPRFLVYSDHDLRHKIVTLYEAAGLHDGDGAYMMRSLLSEGRLHLGTVQKDHTGAMEGREVVKEGPTALFTTTTSPALDAELETRALSLSISDDEQHTRAILQGTARASSGPHGDPPDLTPWHALQTWLEVAGEHRVYIPYSPQLAARVPARAIRMRRDFPKLQTLIKACAILHQAQRKLAADGAILASIDDYRIVRDLLADVFAAAQQDGLTDKQRAAVDAVAAECSARGAAGAEGVSLTAVATRLNLDKSATSRRLANPLKQHYIMNMETRKGQPAAYVLGEPLPPQVTNMLPDPSTLRDREVGEL